MASAAQVRLEDSTFYPVEEKVGQDSLQTFVTELFRGLVDRWLVGRGNPCFVRSVGKGEHVRLRLATGPRGETLFPTEAEAERARADEERTRAEQERTRADEAEAEVARLQAELERMKAGR